MSSRIKALTKIPVCLALLVSAVPAPAAKKEWRAPKPRVVISFSHTAPDTAYWRRHAEWLELRPFDGVALEISPRDAEWHDEAYWRIRSAGARADGDPNLAECFERPRENGTLRSGGWGLASQSWNPNEKYTEKTFAKAVADLQAVNSKRFKWNMILAMILGPEMDWFDDQDWAQRCQNVAMLARLAKQGGCKGILFDDENYSGAPWDYGSLRTLNLVHGKSFAETQAKARQRGREYARAMCKEFPDIVFWTLHGYSTYAYLTSNVDPRYRRVLSNSFYDGVLEGSSDQMIFVDGGELAYGFNLKEHFEWGRKMVLEEPIRLGLTQVPQLHRKKVRCGFGIWPDYYGKLTPGDPDNSYFSSGRFQRAIYWALRFSDGYVWVWGQGRTWWVEGPDDRAAVDMAPNIRGLPLAYWKALQDGRTSPGSDTSAVRTMFTTNLPTKGRNGCTDGSELPKFLKNTEKVYELPVEGWTFKLDDWGSFVDDPKEFKPINIGTTWDRQGFVKPDKTGWYRLEFTLPENLKGRRQLYFYLPDVDGSVWLYSIGSARPVELGSRYIGLEPQSNRKPFTLSHDEIPRSFFIPGKPWSIVLKVQALSRAGGILAPVQVLAEK